VEHYFTKIDFHNFFVSGSIVCNYISIVIKIVLVY